jgi:hypothetical protein
MPLIFDGGFLSFPSFFFFFLPFFFRGGGLIKFLLSAETTSPLHQQHPSILGPGSDRSQELGLSWSPYSSPRAHLSLCRDRGRASTLRPHPQAGVARPASLLWWALPFVQPPPSLKLL